jgi:hypothetical protein
MNALTRRHPFMCPEEDVPIEVRREIERAFPRLEPAFVCARDEVCGRVDKGSSLFVPLAQRARVLRMSVRERELEAHVEEVPSHECAPAGTTSRCRESYGRIRERFGESGELRCRTR